MTMGTSFEEDSQSVSERGDHMMQATRPTILCRVIFTGLGLLLLVAAGFKTYEAYSVPMSSLSLVAALVLITFEFSFGVWLAAGLRSEWTWGVALACFAVFACVSANKYVAGESSCGCFGTLQVSPAITLVIDVVAVTLLVPCRTGVEMSGESRLRQVFPPVASFAVGLSLVAASVSLYGQSRFVRSDGLETGSGELVVLEPESWVGYRWPLLAESGLKTELARGEWDVLLFRHDCHVCHDVMVELAQLLPIDASSRRVALVGIDEPSTDELVSRLEQKGCRIVYLPQDREWFVTTPLRLRLIDGICVSATVIDTWN